MKKENVKIGMMVELTEDYGQLPKGNIYKILECQVEGSSCFIVEHNGDESYLAPFCTNFKPYKNSVDMKKHEIIKYAYENYPKGTKFYSSFSGNECVSDGSFNFSTVAPNCLITMGNDVFTNGTWATIVTEEKPKELEIGKWYKNNTYKGSVVFKCNEISNYGTWEDKWGDCWMCGCEKSWTLATNEEILEALKKEAIKRGFVEGVTVSQINKSNIGNPINPFKLDNRKYFLHEGCLFKNNICLFKNGQWAEIIKQPKEKYYAIMKGVQDNYYTTEILNTEEEVMRTVDKLSKRDNSSLHSINQFPINN